MHLVSVASQGLGSERLQQCQRHAALLKPLLPRHTPVHTHTRTTVNHNTHFTARKCSRVKGYILESPRSSNPASTAVKEVCLLVTTNMGGRCNSDCGHRVVAEPAPSASFGTRETCDVESASSTRPIGPTPPRRNRSGPQLRIFDPSQEPAPSYRPHLRPCHVGNALKQWRRAFNHL